MDDIIQILTAANKQSNTTAAPSPLDLWRQLTSSQAWHDHALAAARAAARRQPHLQHCPEDLAQQMVIQLLARLRRDPFLGLDTTRPKNQQTHFLSLVLRQLAAEASRLRTGRYKLASSYDDRTASRPTTSDTDDRLDLLEALQHLPTRYAQVITLRLHGLPVASVAAIVGTTYDMVSQISHYAKRTLQKRLAQTPPKKNHEQRT
jgi:RNA polymerase sigma factor (sigma-70 family)